MFKPEQISNGDLMTNAEARNAQRLRKRSKITCTQCQKDKHACVFDEKVIHENTARQCCDRCLKLEHLCSESSPLPISNVDSSQAIWIDKEVNSSDIKGIARPRRSKKQVRMPEIIGMQTFKFSDVPQASRLQIDSDRGFPTVDDQECEEWKDKMLLNTAVRQQAMWELRFVESIAAKLGKHGACRERISQAREFLATANKQRQQVIKEGSLLTKDFGSGIAIFLLKIDEILSETDSVLELLWKRSSRSVHTNSISDTDSTQQFGLGSSQSQNHNFGVNLNITRAPGDFEPRENLASADFEQRHHFYHRTAKRIVQARRDYNIRHDKIGEDASGLAAHLAYRHNDHEVAIAILNESETAIKVDHYERSVLHYAADRCDEEFFDMVLEKSPQLLEHVPIDCFGLNLMAAAAMHDHKELFHRISVLNPQMRQHVDGKSRSLFAIAARAGSYNLVYQLLEEGDFYQPYGLGADFLHALEGQNNPVIDMMFRKLRQCPETESSRLNDIKRAAITFGRGDVAAELREIKPAAPSAADAYDKVTEQIEAIRQERLRPPDPSNSHAVANSCLGRTEPTVVPSFSGQSQANSFVTAPADLSSSTEISFTGPPQHDCSQHTSWNSNRSPIHFNSPFHPPVNSTSPQSYSTPSNQYIPQLLSTYPPDSNSQFPDAACRESRDHLQSGLGPYDSFWESCGQPGPDWT